MAKHDDHIIIGLFKEIEDKEKYPSLYDEIGFPMEPKIKDAVLRYMMRSSEIARALTTVKDVIDPDSGWRCSPLKLISDGKYEWRSDLPHYVEKYDLRLPEEFVAHILDSEREKEANK